MNAGRRTLGPVGGGGGGLIPSGYVYETGIVEVVNNRTLRVNREAQFDYTPGRNLVLMNQGKVIPASVVASYYNTTDSKTYFNANMPVSGATTVLIDKSPTYIPGIDQNTILHFNFDNSPTLNDSFYSGITITTAGTVGLTSTSPKFGAQCLQIGASSSGIGVLASNLTTAVVPTFANLGCTWEGWYYGNSPTTLTGWTYYYNAEPNGSGYVASINGAGQIYWGAHRCLGGDHTGDWSLAYSTTAALSTSIFNHIVVQHDVVSGILSLGINGVFQNWTGLSGYLAQLGWPLAVNCASDTAYGALWNFGVNGAKYDDVRISSVPRYKTGFSVPPMPFGGGTQ